MDEARALPLLRKYLKARDETATAFAVRAGIDRSTFQHIVSGRRAPGLEIALQIRDATKGEVPAEAWVAKRSGRGSRTQAA